MIGKEGDDDGGGLEGGRAVSVDAFKEKDA